MSTDAARYARITHRLAQSLATSDGGAGQQLAFRLQQRIIDSLVSDCAPQVTSADPAERLRQAVAALAQRGVVVQLAGDALIQQRCFCDASACGHAAALLGRLVGVVPSIGAGDAVRYTKEASRNVSRLRS